MSHDKQDAPRVVPAQLSFLAIYNPSLGATDETFRDQVVFYHSTSAAARRKASASQDGEQQDEQREEENEKLRQIGLAQGMVGFAKSFSNGEAVDAVETEKSRIVMRELQPSWWILASIDLTRLPKQDETSSKSDKTPSASTYEYSAREVSTPALLLQHLVTAQLIFSLHHGPSLNDLFARSGRQKFCNTLHRFWARFAANWDVFLHGSPAVDMFGGLKLAAGGELGIGVGEEEWGSGEREVLEHFASRTDGLVDLMVSRFGDSAPEQAPDSDTPSSKKQTREAIKTAEPWMGSGRLAEAADGVVFSGVGAVSRRSLRDIACWTHWIYAYGDHAYGVRDSPTSDRRNRRQRARRQNMNGRVRSSAHQSVKASVHVNGSASIGGQPAVIADLPPGIPPPISARVQQSLDHATQSAEQEHGSGTGDEQQDSSAETEGWIKYLTLGYGSAWGPTKKRPQTSRQASQQHATNVDKESREETPEQPLMRHLEPEPEPEPEGDRLEERIKTQIQEENTGHFLIGLKGDLEADDDEAADEDGDGDGGSRMLLRTLYIERNPSNLDRKGSTTSNTSDMTLRPHTPSFPTRLRVIVYVHRPFIYTLLFEPQAPSLFLPSLYRTLHTYLAPLHRPLSASTSPSRIAARIEASSHPFTTSVSTGQSASGAEQQPIYDLVYDPKTLTVHSSIPNIPDPSTASAEGLGAGAGWTRVEALNIHSQILSTVASTRRVPDELERTCKTSRGWWVVWMRLPPSDPDASRMVPRAKSERSSPSLEEQAMDVKGVEYGPVEHRPKPPRTKDLREAFLVRRARDSTAVASGSSNRSASGMFGWSLGVGKRSETGGAAAGWGPARLAEGIGVDARRYVEGLLSLNR